MTIKVVLKLMLVFWLFLGALLIEFVLYNTGALSDSGLTHAVKITVYVYLPLIFVHLWVLNRRKRNSVKNHL